jgi:hypothetical protein
MVGVPMVGVPIGRNILSGATMCCDTSQSGRGVGSRSRRAADAPGGRPKKPRLPESYVRRMSMRPKKSRPPESYVRRM